MTDAKLTQQGKAKWPNVTRVNPCVICDGSDWCAISPDGKTAQCRRRDSSPMYGKVPTRYDKNQQPYYIFHITGRAPVGPRPVSIDPHEKAAKTKSDGLQQWLGEDRFHHNLTTDVVKQFALFMGLPDWALRVRGVGAFMLPFDDQSWRTGLTDFGLTFAERDGAERIVGFSQRWPEGKKRHLTGTSRGLFVPEGWRERPGPLYLVEGASDVLAMIAAGLCAIGRPSNLGGVEYLAELLANLPSERRIIVVGENDRKEDGRWPGRHGAYVTATNLAAAMHRPVFWTMVPVRSKDFRDWLTNQQRLGDSQPVWAKVGQQLSEMLEADAVAAEPHWPSFGELPNGELKCRKVFNLRLAGRKGEARQGTRAVARVPCDSWSGCPRCRAAKSVQLSSWGYRCVYQWCDPARMADEVPRVESERRGSPTGDYQSEQTGPFALYYTSGTKEDWGRRLKSIEKRSGVEYVSVLHGEQEEAVFALVAIPPGCSPFPGLVRCSADDGYRRLCDAVGEIRDREVVPKKRHQPINFSLGWKLIKSQFENASGNWDLEGSTHMDVESVASALTSLGASLLNEDFAPKTGGEAVAWRDFEVGGALTSWLASALMDGTHTVRRLNEQEHMDRVLAWHAFFIQHNITDSPKVREELRHRLFRYPEAADVQPLWDAMAGPVPSDV